MESIIGNAVKNVTDNMALASAGTFLGFSFIMVLIWIIVVAACVLLFIFWIFMIIDAAKREFKNETDKIVWILVLVLVGYLGAIIYYFAVKHEQDKKIAKKK